MKKHLYYLTVMLLLPLSILAQDKVLTGVVSSVEEGALPGVSIALKGTAIGTLTDANGKFSIKVPASGGILVFSAIGFQTLEEKIDNKTTYTISLIADARALNEVVVTALGISREKKSLGFSQQEVKGDNLVEARSTNVVNSLAGRIAGVRISSNGGPGSGSTIQIRGSSSVSGNNQPLIVLDGVPLQQQYDK